MRCLALVTDGFGAGGGIARYNQNLMAALALSARVEAVAVLPRFGAPAAATPDKIVQLAASPGKAAWAARAAALMARGRYDAVFCGHLNAAPLADALARAGRARLWLQVHGIEAWTPRGGAALRAVERARLVTSVSRYTRAQLLRWADADPARVRVLSNTYAEPAGSQAGAARLRRLHGLEGKPVILTVGRLAAGEQYKGHDRVIRALPQVAASCPAVVYLIVGDGDDRPRLAGLAQAEGVQERVVFAGQVDETDLPDYFRLADVFAMPSVGEGFGIVFLEAAAAGAPVIAGNRDGSVDALADGAVGALIDPRDASALAAALTLNLERRPAQGGEAVRRFAFPHFARHVDVLVRHFF